MSSAGPAVSPSSAHKLFQEILQGSGIYLIGSIAQRIVSVLVVPITTRCLTPAEFGIADLLTQCTDVISMLLGANLGSAVGYFYFEKDSAEDRRRVVTTNILGALLLGFVATLICRPFSEPLARFVFRDASAARYFNLLLLLMPAMFACEAVFTLFRVENRPIAYTGMSFLGLLMQFSGIVLLVAYFKLHVMGMVYTSCVTATVMTLIMGGAAFRRYHSKFDPQLFVRMLKYAFPLGLGGIGMFFIHVGDRFILPHYRSLSDLGLYVLAYKFGMLLSFVYGSFQSYWTAQVFAIMKRDDSASIFARLFTYVMLIVSGAAVGLVVCARPILHIMAAPAYWEAEALIPIIVGAYYARSIGDFLRCLFMTINRPGYSAMCTWIAAAVCAGAYWLLIPKFGMWGAAYATLITFIVMAAVSAVWTYRLQHYRVEGARLTKIAAACVAALLPYSLIRASSLPASIATSCLSMALFPLTLWVLHFPTAGEWEMAAKGLSKLRQRFS